MRLQGAMEEMAGLFERIRTAFFKAGGHAEVFEMLDPLALGWRISESEASSEPSTATSRFGTPPTRPSRRRPTPTNSV